VIHQLPENVAIAPLPAINVASFTLADGWMWAISDSSEERRQITTALAEFLMDRRSLPAWTEAAHLLPTSQIILKQWQNQTDAGTINEVAASARIIPSNEFLSAISPILQQGTLGIVADRSITCRLSKTVRRTWNWLHRTRVDHENKTMNQKQDLKATSSPYNYSWASWC